MDPVASIIMPCFNSSPYLDAALSSVWAQTFTDFELIAIDDGSTDATRAILENAAERDRRLKIIAQPNRGVSSARNRGLDAARGRYIFFIDPDDTAQPNMLSRAIARLEQTQSDCCLFAYQRRIGERGEWRKIPLQGVYEYASANEIIDGFFPHLFGYSDDQARIWGRRGNWQAGREEGAVWRGGYRMEVIRRCNVRFDETIVLYEDAMFNCEFLISASSMTCLNEALYNYTVRPSGAATRLNHSMVRVTNKLRMLAKRDELDARTHGRLWPLYSASCVFSAMEIIYALWRRPSDWREGLRQLRTYLASPSTRRALSTFPLPSRRPLALLLVLVLRGYCRIAAACTHGTAESQTRSPSAMLDESDAHESETPRQCSESPARTKP